MRRGRAARAIGLALAAAALGATGCVTDQGYLTLAATRPVQLDVSEVDPAELPVVRGVRGRHTAVTSVLFFPTFDGPQLELAVADALAGGHGDVLTRASVHTTKWWFLIGIETLTVEGNVVDLPGGL
jgi:hypothetical protein